LTLKTGAFNLKDIAYVDVVDRQFSAFWTGVFLTFKTAEGRPSINQGDLPNGFTDPRTMHRETSSFEWHLGSVRPGTATTSLRELGNRLTNAFSNAVSLCGGALTKAPF
jgi:hypothetical protein